MSIFSIITLLGGIAFFLFGMNVMSGGLEKVAGSKLEQTLKKLTGNRFKAFLLGAGVTAVIQSSAAVTVMLVGLVNSGLMSFSQTVGAVMGSNVGTTVTAWILSLAGIEGDSVALKLLKPENFSMVFAFFGIMLHMFSKKERNHGIGNILIGFAVLMAGMSLMLDATAPLQKEQWFIDIFAALKNPLLGVLFGAVFTAAIQSSSASVGVLQALAATGVITYGAAIPIIMGQNIGTCITAIISSIGVSRNAKKVSVVHLSFNIIGTLMFLIPFLLIDWIIGFSFTDKAIDPVTVAIIHSVFNLAATAILLPFGKQIEKLANRIIKTEDDDKKHSIRFDERLLNMPSVAVSAAFDGVSEMCRIAGEAFSVSNALVTDFSEEGANRVAELEEKIDRYEDRIGSFMVKLSREEITITDSHQAAKILHTINDFERIGDHACNLVKVGREIHDKQIHFSEQARGEIAVLERALIEIMDITQKAFCENDVALAARVEPLEQVIDRLISKIKKHHINRLQQGDCTIELGFVLGELINNYERISDHCSNIAVAILESEHDSFKTHEYLKNYKSDDEYFKECYEEYKERFAI